MLNEWGGGGHRYREYCQTLEGSNGKRNTLVQGYFKGQDEDQCRHIARELVWEFFFISKAVPWQDVMMERNNNIEVCRRDSYSGFKKISQMTFRSFPKLKFLNLKTLKFVQNIQPSTYVANWPLTNGDFLRKGNK